jgi:tetratricopeptide (TPR) repeat protein
MAASLRSAWATSDLCRVDPACSQWDDRGRQHFTSKEYAKALDDWQQALALQPEPRLILNVGRCHHWLGQYDAARQAYKQYQERNPSPEPDDRARLERYIQETEAAQRAQEMARGTPVYKKWWFWTVIGVTAAGIVVGGVVGGLSAANNSFSRTVVF